MMELPVHWSEVSISVSREEVPAVESALQQLGVLAVTLEDDESHPVIEPGPGVTPLWPSVNVRGLFEPDVDRSQVLAALQAVTATDRLDPIRWRAVEDMEWERAWMERFEPMQFGRRLWVVPSGMPAPSGPGNTVVHLDPGMAFGTGTHPTTALCLEWLDGQNLESATVVDYGCGSGILGIAAARKGAAQVICVDNDPQALAVTRNNASSNGVTRRISCQSPESFSISGVDFVIANILSEPLIDLAPVLLPALRYGGALALSGILEEQAEAVVAAYRAGVEFETPTFRDGWLLLQGRRTGCAEEAPGR